MLMMILWWSSLTIVISDASPLLVSVITPTRNSTQPFHAQVYRLFNAQTYAHRELLIYDDSPFPSSFFATLNDTRVQYYHKPDANSTLGIKRNWLIGKSHGSIIAHFDDDDYYHPNYLTVMISEMQRLNASFIKLSGWWLYGCRQSFFGFYDAEEPSKFSSVAESSQVGATKHGYFLMLDPRDDQVQTWVHPSDLRAETMWGFGFGFIYTKSLAIKHPFSDLKNFGEDSDWTRSLLASKDRPAMATISDKVGIAMHVQGDWNTSRFPTQYRIPKFAMKTLLGESAVAHIDAVCPNRKKEPRPRKRKKNSE